MNVVVVCKGGLFTGHINERTNEPDALIAESVANGLPVVYVAMNYRLNSEFLLNIWFHCSSPADTSEYLDLRSPRRSGTILSMLD